MKFLRKTAQYTLYDHKKNQDTIKELITQSIIEKNNKYKKMDTTHPQNGQILTPTCHNRIMTSRHEEPRKTARLLDGYIEARMGHKA
jgi:hypothetical protein